MSKLYSNPWRVYLVLGILAVAGLFSATRLPVSLFPNSSKPIIQVHFPFGSQTPAEFLNTYGNFLESKLQAISTDSAEVEKIKATYQADSADYEMEFRWGDQPRSALREVESIVNPIASRLPDDIRSGVGVWPDGSNQGFFAASFYSPKRSLEQIHEILEPLLISKLNQVRDSTPPELWNPSQKEIRIELDPKRMASHLLLPKNIEQSVVQALTGHSGGSTTIGINNFSIQMPRQILDPSHLSRILIPSPTSIPVRLSDIAKVEYALQSKENHIFKTSGMPSIILYATPRTDGNVKRMSDDMLSILHTAMKDAPEDIQYKILVNPAESIQASVENVFKEVLVGICLTVCVLFFFIGSFRNIITTAIEIPLSMILAFILMRFSNMNLNLVSLGGFALSAGMNVDASVVVMENIFRHLESVKTHLNFEERVRLIVQAVNEVKFPIIVSTLSSLVVFIPLTFTSKLTYAILGDLAKTVVFSHGLSAIIALILVPTVRLHLMKPGEKLPVSPIEKYMVRLEKAYLNLLRKFLSRPRLQLGCLLGLSVLLVSLFAFILPKLPREIIGKPDTDWVCVTVTSQGNTQLNQMETIAEELEAKLFTVAGPRALYTFAQIVGPNSSYLMLRLKNKKEMREVWNELERDFPSTAHLQISVNSWSPAELPIPNPPQLRITLRGGNQEDRASIAQQLHVLLDENHVFPRLWTTPPVQPTEDIVLRPYYEYWASSKEAAHPFLPADLADFTRVVTHGKKIGEIPIKGRNINIVIGYPENTIQSVEDIAALPIGIGSKVLPFKAIARVSRELSPPILYREEKLDLVALFGKNNESDNSYSAEKQVTQARQLVSNWQKNHPATDTQTPQPTILFEDGQQELKEGLTQLSMAACLSVFLILLTLILQFGNISNALVILAAIPFGLIGVLPALFIFKSTLSLNSILGVILLNGLAVGNSIILVERMNKFIEQVRTKAIDGDFKIQEAIVLACQQRLRPILITSLTTILGMLPIALGLGEGGRVLQPLGIAVCSGLWISTSLTLFLVPALQAFAAHRKRARSLALFAGTLLFAAGLSSNSAQAELLKFDQALQRIQARSTENLLQRQELGGTRIKNLPARLALLPSLTFNVQRPLTEMDNPFVEASKTTLDAEMNLFRFGGDFFNLRAAHADTASQEAAVQATLFEIEEKGTLALLTQIQKQLEIQVNQAIVKNRTRSLDIGEKRYKRGLLPQQEMEMLSVDLENAKAHLTDIEVEGIEAQNSLKNLLGDDEVIVEWPWQATFLKESSRLDRLNLDFSRLPKWHAAQEKARAERFRWHQTQTKMAPSVDAKLGYGYNRNPDFDGLAWTGIITLTFPLFDRLTQYSETVTQAFKRDSAETQIVQIERDARARWETARKTFRLYLQSAIQRDRTLQLSRKLHLDNLTRFQSGRIDANDFVVDQNRLTDSELLVIEGWSKVHSSYISFCHSLGFRVAECSLQGGS